jgi:hypothetical protein
MADKIDDLFVQLKSFAGVEFLPLTAREIIETFIDDKVREKFQTRLAKLARELQQRAEHFHAKAETDALMMLIEPEPQKARRKKGLSNTQKAEYYRDAGQIVRGHMSDNQAQHRAPGR